MKALLAVVLALALGGCELAFQYQFTKAWACQGQKEAARDAEPGDWRRALNCR